MPKAQGRAVKTPKQVSRWRMRASIALKLAQAVAVADFHGQLLPRSISLERLCESYE
jgi:hypothetical protein